MTSRFRQLRKNAKLRRVILPELPRLEVTQSMSRQGTTNMVKPSPEQDIQPPRPSRIFPVLDSILGVTKSSRTPAQVLGTASESLPSEHREYDHYYVDGKCLTHGYDFPCPVGEGR